jgi:hypothetical protein
MQFIFEMNSEDAFAHNSVPFTPSQVVHHDVGDGGGLE